MTAISSAVAIGCVLVSPPAQAQTGAALPTWMVGCWRTAGGRSTVSERWVAAGDSLVGLGTTVSGGRLVEFEFLRIIGEAVPVYLAQPGGRPPTRFVSTSSAASQVVFENSAHDYPKRIGYERSGEDLRAWIDDGQGGRRVSIPMRRIVCDDPAP